MCPNLIYSEETPAPEQLQHVNDVADLNQQSVGSEPDGLLLALAFLSRYHLQPQSIHSLTAGLPVDGSVWDPELFIRAAESAGFRAAIAQRQLEDILPETLPVVLLMQNESPIVLESLLSDQATIVSPSQGYARQSLPLDQLSQRYSGSCLYCKPVKEQNTQPKHWFWDTIKLSRGIYLEVVLASLLINLFALVTPLFIMNVYDRVVPNYAVETLWVLASGVAIIFLFDLAMKTLRGYFIDLAGKRADILLSAQTFAKVMDIELGSRPKQIGSFANNLQDFDSFREFFTSSTLSTLIDLPFVLLFLILIYGIGGPIVLVPVIAIPIVIVFGLMIQAPLKNLIRDTFNQSAAKHALLIEALGALDAIKANRAEGQIQTRWENLNGTLARLTLKSRWLSAAVLNFSQIVSQVTTIVIVITGVYLIMSGDLSVGGLIACTILTGRCLGPMTQIAGILTRYHHSIASYKSIDQMMNLPVERPANRNFLQRDTLSGQIQFRNVTFSYPGQRVPAVEDINITIEPGEKVALVGKMGSGKSTLLKLTLGFHSPTEGALLLSDTDIHQLDPRDIRRNATYVSQDVQILSGTVRDNITLGAPMVSDEQIRHAAGLAGLLEFIQQHPDGFDMQVGEQGNALSGGQRQALCLARAMLKQAPLLLLDEPTSGMDSTAEQHFKDYLQGLNAEVTLVLVTHKSNMLSLVDRLILVNEGKVIADGPRDEVLRSLAGS